MGKSDIVTGLALLVFGVAVFIASMGYPFGSIEQPGSGFFPSLASGILILLSLSVILGPWLKKEKVAMPAFFPTRDAPKRVVITVGFFLGYRLLFPFLGMAPTNFLFFFLTSRLLGHHSWRTSLLFSLLAAVSSYLLFQVWLDIPMPDSIFGL